MTMTRVLVGFLVLLCSQDVPPGARPVPKDGKWIERHKGFVEEARRGGIEVLFLGDSITDAWRSTGRKIWDEHFAPLKAVNFGISGDRTQHVLWRLQNGELDGVRPKVVVLMIGTNNIGQRDPEPPSSAVEGIKAIVREIHARSASTRVLLLGVFPRSEKPDHPHRAQIREINDAIAKLDDGGKTVRFLDIGGRFLGPDGTISKEIMPDFLHLSEKGYRLWAEALREPLRELLGT